MIRSYGDKRTAAIGDNRLPKGFPADQFKRCRAMLTALNAATRLEDLRFPPGNHLEKLSGDRAGQHSVRVNRQWRVCFTWIESGPEDVEFTDYH